MWTSVYTFQTTDTMRQGTFFIDFNIHWAYSFTDITAFPFTFVMVNNNTNSREISKEGIKCTNWTYKFTEHPLRQSSYPKQ